MATCDLIIPCAPHHQVDAAQVIAYLDQTQALAKY